MAKPRYDRDTRRLIADFHSRIKELKRDGVLDFPPLGGRLPWAQATEERKLENIAWESMSVWPFGGDVVAVPDIVRLEAVERNVDYSKLQDETRSALQGLRADPDADIAAELERIAGLEYGGDDPARFEPPPVGPAVPISPAMERVLTEVEKSWSANLGHKEALAQAAERAPAKAKEKEKSR